MHEVFLAAGARKLVYPNSGPGPISAVGSDEVAYFGEVSNAEVLTADEFRTQIPEFMTASLTNDNIPWLKFRYQGKFLFIKKQAIFRLSSLTSWRGLYNAGLIYGEEGTGPDFVTGEKIQQLRIVKKGSYSFKVRTITADAAGIATQTPGSGSDVSPRRKSMFHDLLYRVVLDPIPEYPEKKFEKYTWNEVIPQVEVTREILINASYPNGVVLLRGSFSGAEGKYITGYHLGSTALTTDYYYRPVLELIAQNELFNLGTYRISVTGVLRGAVSGLEFGASSTGSETTVLRLADFSATSAFKKPIGQWNVSDTGSPNRLLDYKASRELSKPLGVSSMAVGGEPARLMAIMPTHKPVVRVSDVNFTITI